MDRQRPRQVGEENDAGLQRRDEQRLELLVIAGDLSAQLRYPGGDLAGRQVDVADGRVLGGPYDTSFRPNRWARRSMSRR
jgi:hypothetical protein